MNRIAVITGAGGMDAKTLTHILLSKNYHVVLTYRRNTQLNINNIRDLFIEDLQRYPRSKLTFQVCDITDKNSISECLKYITWNIGIIDELYLLAAMSHVGNSFTQKEYSILANGQSYYYFLETIKEHSKNTKIYGALCYDEKTRVVTPDGIKNYNELKEGDLIFSLNPKTKEIEIHPIKSIHIFDYDGKMIHFKGIGKDLLVTPEHRVFYKTLKGKIMSKSAKDIREMSKFTLPLGTWIGKSYPEFTDLKQHIPDNLSYTKTQIEKIKTEDLFYLIGVYIGDGSSNIMTNKYLGCSLEDRENNKDNLGRYTNSDNLPKKFKISKTARIVIDIPPSDEAYLKVTECLNRNNINWTLHNNIDITFFSWGVYYFLSQCGHKSHEKYIPKWVLEADKKLLHKLYEGILDSDGYKKRDSITTTSKKLIENLAELGAKLGKHIHFFENKLPSKPVYIENRLIKSIRKSYSIYFLKSQIHYQKNINTKWYKKNNIAPIVDYNGKVWCFHLEKNHNFLVERNGYIVFSGNTSELAGNVKDGAFFNEETIWNPKSPYSIGKALGGHWIKFFRESNDSNLFACFGVLFNHSNVYRNLDFAIRKITNTAAKIILGKEKELRLAHLDWARDEHWSDFGCEMMWKMLQNSNPKDYVIGNGETHWGEEYVNLAFSYFNLSWKNYVKFDETLIRPNEVVRLVSDSFKAEKELGWKRNRMSFKQHIELLCKYDYDLESGLNLKRPNVFEMFPNEK